MQNYTRYIKPLFASICLVIILMAGGYAVFSHQEFQASFSKRDIHVFDSIIKKHGILGGTIICFNTSDITQYAFGMARLDQKKEWNDSTYFRIASISKFITTIAIMQLIEQRAFSLDTDISTLLSVALRNPAYRDIPITVRMLLNHTSTIKDSDRAFEFAKRSILIDTISQDSIIPSIQTLFTQQFIQHEAFLPKTISLNNGTLVNAMPGTFFNYTNINFVILAWILERASGLSFAEYVQRHIFRPINIKAGYVVQDLPKDAVISTQYRYSKKQWIAEGDVSTKPFTLIYKPIISYKAGHNPFRFSPQAGLRIKGKDLAILLQNLLSTETLLTSKSKEEMFSESWRAETNNSRHQFNDLFQSWGLGVQILTNTPGKDAINGLEKQYIGHIGRANGAYSTMFFNKQTHKGFIIFLNGIKSLPSSDHGFLKCEKELMSLLLKYQQHEHE